MVDIYRIKTMILYSVNKNILIIFHICVTMAFHFPPIETLNQCWFNAGPSSIHPELFQRLVFAITTASSMWDVIFMNDKFARKVIEWLINHANKNCR